MEQELLLPEVGFRRDRQAPAPNSGNGRPKGARNSRHKILRKMAESQAPAVLDTVISAALGGDMYAAKIVLDRVWPRPRHAPLVMPMQQTQTPADLREAMHETLQLVAAGKITTDDGAALTSMMKDMLQAHAIEITSNAFGAGAQTSLDNRSILADRLARIVERRGIAAPAVADDPD